MEAAHAFGRYTAVTAGFDVHMGHRPRHGTNNGWPIGLSHLKATLHRRLRMSTELFVALHLGKEFCSRRLTFARLCEDIVRICQIDRAECPTIRLAADYFHSACLSYSSKCLPSPPGITEIGMSTAHNLKL
jgi:hypothetical protein